MLSERRWSEGAWRAALVISVVVTAACGVRTEPLSHDDDTSTDSDNPNVVEVMSGDGGACFFGKNAFQPTACTWGFTFGGDVIACIGFSEGTATGSRCAACGIGPGGLPAAYCDVGGLGDSTGYMLSCSTSAETAYQTRRPDTPCP